MLRLLGEIKFGQDAVLCCVNAEGKPTYNTLPDELIYDSDVETKNKVVVLDTADDCFVLYKLLMLHQVLWWSAFVAINIVVAATYLLVGPWCFLGSAVVALLMADKVMNIPDGIVVDAKGIKLDTKNFLAYIPDGEIVALGRD